MDCDKHLERLSAWLDGALTQEEERELREHLARCPSCREVQGQLSALRDGFGELEETEAPEGFTQGVMDCIQEEARPKVIPLFKRPQFRALAGLAACLVLAVGLYSVKQPGEPEKWGEMARGFKRGAVSGSVEADGPMMDAALAGTEPAEGPRIAAYSAGAPGDSEELPAGPVLVLDRMPEGAAELIPPETEVSPTEDRLGTVYHSLSQELIAQITGLAQEQEIAASLPVSPGEDVLYDLMILETD